MENANPQRHEEVTIHERINSREIKERFIKGKHCSLEELRVQMPRQRPVDYMLKYLMKYIPPYPTPAEFWVSDVAHVTEEYGFMGILKSEQFRPPVSDFSWWDIKINKEEIRAAEMRYVEKNFSIQAEELKKPEAFMETFTTSPLFQPEKSRYGNYRFTFPLTDLMQWYKKQNCGGEEPVLRVYETITYRQEIVYTVLIHSPEDNKLFEEYPLLEASEWVRYKDGRIIWNAQAISETHWYQFVSGEVQRLNTYQFYVWDQVSLVFHLPNCKKIEIDRKRLINALEACKLDNIDLSGYRGPKDQEERFSEAKMKVSELKRELEEEEKEKEIKDDDKIKMEVDP
ncbi:uncharacterized protein LOC108270429 isoform X1 [Ictalurus punctatus]|uniref:Uncharacterized protein LOC108270429 isoform X1 n=1 Tax=Ictalurus punctatus TaxID=7998 RepID=A0A2D0RR07_ICTPU|nr:uncharacterized protein LOC108270429 isoform X1 [Ictalurus punctatus]